MYLVALNLLVNNQLNSSLRHIIITIIFSFTGPTEYTPTQDGEESDDNITITPPKNPIQNPNQELPDQNGLVFELRVEVDEHKTLESRKRKVCPGAKEENKSKRKKEDFVCKACNTSFAYKQGLSRHVDVVHLGHKAFKCETCGKCFQAKQVLQNHVNSVHENKEFPCSYCGKLLSRRDKKLDHESKCPKKK